MCRRAAAAKIYPGPENVDEILRRSDYLATTLARTSAMAIDATKPPLWRKKERAEFERVVAISPDPNAESQKIADGLRLGYRFLSDRDLSVTRRYGLVHARGGPGAAPTSGTSMSPTWPRSSPRRTSWSSTG